MPRSTGNPPNDQAAKPTALNRFGSIHTTQKLVALEQYLSVYTQALKKLPFVLHYFDAFAGSGECEITIRDHSITIPGSAHIAIECNPPFQKLIFIEESARKVKALQQLTAEFSNRNIKIVRGDSNEILPQLLSTLNPKTDRAVVFLDPFGMQVDWKTLEYIAATKIVDLIYLFPLSGLYRQATNNANNIDADKEAALYRIFRTMEWRTAFYEAPKQQGLFDTPPDIRSTDALGMVDWVKKRLETIFAGVANPMVLYQTRPDGKRGPPNFALFAAISNPSPSAVGLFLRLANAVIKHPQL
jgi:three-Cys-motif partner protein